MARPPRIEFAGAVYHVSSHCEAGGRAFADDGDRREFLTLLAQAAHRFDAQVLAYCLGDTDFQFVLFTRQANLSRLMRHLNGVYTQHANRAHGDSGALFQGRFKAVLVDRETLLLDVCRFVELAPVRDGRVGIAGIDTFPWSSYCAHVGVVEAPDWLDTDGLHGYVLGKPIQAVSERKRAAERYARLVASDPSLDLWKKHLRHQIFLGDEAFAQRMLAQAAPRRRTKPSSFGEWQKSSASREQALYRAHTEGGLSMTALAGNLGLSVSRVSRLIAGYERQAGA